MLPFFLIVIWDLFSVIARENSWIDPDTPKEALIKKIDGIDWQLVFSDEFEQDNRSFHPGHDEKWEAVDNWYHVTNDMEMYKPDAVTTQNGSGIITIDKDFGITDNDGNFRNYKSAMVMGWNKFCFTGGYFEVSVKLPGDAYTPGFWPGVWLLGNLGRAGFQKSTDYTWPYSYNNCDAGVNEQPWKQSHLKGQKINACQNNPSDGFNPHQGRGVTEIDLLEVSVPQGSMVKPGIFPVVSTSLQIGPLSPHWDEPDRTISPIGFSGKPYRYVDGLVFNKNNTFHTKRNPWEGNHHQDCISAISELGVKHFNSFHKYALKWVPGQSITFYLEDIFLFTVTQDTLKAVNMSDYGWYVGQRDIPYEPSYIIWNLAISQNFVPIISPDLKFPAYLEIDYMRIWQHPDKKNIGCDTKTYPSKTYIKNHPDLFGIPQCGNHICDGASVECYSCPNDCSEMACYKYWNGSLHCQFIKDTSIQIMCNIMTNTCSKWDCHKYAHVDDLSCTGNVMERATKIIDAWYHMYGPDYKQCSGDQFKRSAEVKIIYKKDDKLQ